MLDNKKSPVITTSALLVLGVTSKKQANGKEFSTLHVSKDLESPSAWIKLSGIEPPLVGTVIKAKGLETTTSIGSILHVNGSDLTYVSGHQGYVLVETLTNVLESNGISLDKTSIRDFIYSKKYHLPVFNQYHLREVYNSLNLPKAHLRRAIDLIPFILDQLTQNMLSNLAKLGGSLKIRDSIGDELLTPELFCKGFTIDNWLPISQGRSEHPALGKKRFFLQEMIHYQGIDNFYRLISIALEKPVIYNAWLNNAGRASYITSGYLKDQMSTGQQMFSSESMQGLKQLGINDPERLLSRNGFMYKINLNGKEVFVTQGAYQNTSRLATLDTLKRKSSPINIGSDLDLLLKNKNIKNLDKSQMEALSILLEGKPLTLLVGPAGTGKSTLLDIYRDILKTKNEPHIILTPTGKASARLNQDLDPEKNTKSRTMHSFILSLSTVLYGAALDSKCVDYGPLDIQRTLNRVNFILQKEKDSQGKVISFDEKMSLIKNTIGNLDRTNLLNTTLIIDESSQLTTDQNALLLALGFKRIIEMGDYSQLTPVGAGEPFHDWWANKELLAAKYPEKIAFAELKKDWRATPELTNITTQIRNGNFPVEALIEQKNAETLLKKGAAIVELDDLQSAQDIALDIFKTVLAETPLEKTTTYMDWHDEMDWSSSVKVPNVMLLASTNKQVNKLNQSCRELLQNDNSDITIKFQLEQLAMLWSKRIQLGDIVMITENNSFITPIRYRTGVSLKPSSVNNGESYVLAGITIHMPNTTSLAATSDWNLIRYATNQTIQPPSFAAEHLPMYQALIQWIDQADESVLESPVGQAALRLRDWSLPVVHFVPVESFYNKKQTKAVTIPVFPLVPSMKNTPERHQAYMNYMACFNGGDSEEFNPQTLRNSAVKALQSLVPSLAYTIHKAQGSQAKVAVTLVTKPMDENNPSSHQTQIYTGGTRAEQSSIFLLAGCKLTEVNRWWNIAKNYKEANPSLMELIIKQKITPLAKAESLVSWNEPMIDYPESNILEDEELKEKWLDKSTKQSYGSFATHKNVVENAVKSKPFPFKYMAVKNSIEKNVFSNDTLDLQL